MGWWWESFIKTWEVGVKRGYVWRHKTINTYAANSVHISRIIGSGNFSLGILNLAQVCGVDGTILNWEFVCLAYTKITSDIRISLLTSSNSSLTSSVVSDREAFFGCSLGWAELRVEDIKSLHGFALLIYFNFEQLIITFVTTSLVHTLNDDVYNKHLFKYPLN